MTPFAFALGREKQDLERFLSVARESWKPSGYDQEMGTRLAYYLDCQAADMEAVLKRVFPNSYQDVQPYYVPLTSYLVNERARVFMEDPQLDLVDENEEPLPEDHELVKFWTKLKDEAGLGLKLKFADRYCELFKTVGVGVYRDPRSGQRNFKLLFPQTLSVVFDPAYPTDLDMALGVAIEIASEGGLSADGEGRRYEFWCARKDEARYLVINGDGKVEEIAGNEKRENPYSDALGPIVPIVPFLSHGDEIGFFTKAGELLVQTNRAVNVAKTDQHKIARTQGYGQMVASMPAGAKAPPAVMVPGPDKVMVFEDGTTVSMLAPGAQLDALDAMIANDVKWQALLSSVPPGAVSLDSRGIASGLAMQIENRPLDEHRKDRVALFRGPMRRLWRVFKAVHNATAKEDNLPVIPEGVQLSWKPGEMAPPQDPQKQQDQDIVDLQNDLTTRAKILSRRLGISEKRAAELHAQMREENAAHRAERMAQQPVAAGRKPIGDLNLNSARERLATPKQQAEQGGGEQPQQ